MARAEIQKYGLGKLKLRGHNISLDKPVSVEAIDDLGNPLELSLKGLLERLNDFEGHRDNQSTKDNLIDCLFSAYEYNQLTAQERLIFEGFIQSNLAGIKNSLSSLSYAETARALILNSKLSKPTNH